MRHGMNTLIKTICMTRQQCVLQSAFKSYVRSRDYCTTAKHVINMCLSVIRCAVELGNFVHVNTYVAKGEQSPEAAKDPVITSKLKAAGGLASLDNKKYKVAAKKFSEVRPLASCLHSGRTACNSMYDMCDWLSFDVCGLGPQRRRAPVC